MLANLSNLVANTVGRITYVDGILHRKAYTDNGKGTLSRALDDVPVKVQVDQLTQAQRPEGWAEDDVRLLVLVDGLSKWLPNGRLQDDDLITVESQKYAIAGPQIDPLKTHWTCRGRRKNP